MTKTTLQSVLFGLESDSTSTDIDRHVGPEESCKANARRDQALTQEDCPAQGPDPPASPSFWTRKAVLGTVITRYRNHTTNFQHSDFHLWYDRPREGIDCAHGCMADLAPPWTALQGLPVSSTSTHYHLSIVHESCCFQPTIKHRPKTIEKGSLQSRPKKPLARHWPIS